MADGTCCFLLVFYLFKVVAGNNVTANFEILAILSYYLILKYMILNGDKNIMFCSLFKICQVCCASDTLLDAPDNEIFE